MYDGFMVMLCGVGLGFVMGVLFATYFICNSIYDNKTKDKENKYPTIKSRFPKKN